MRILERPAQFRYEYFQGGLSREAWEGLMQTSRQRRAVRDLRKKKWIQDREKGDQVIFRIAKEVAVQHIRGKIRATERMLSKGTSVLVLFDFPVGANMARQEWRRFLKSIGCRQEQLSVWSTPLDVGKELAALLILLGLEKWCKVYLGVEIKNDAK